MSLPIDPPLKPMLAKLTRQIPEGDGWLYEPKWDGFRAIVFKDASALQILSRAGQPLDRYFPELGAPLSESLPDCAVVDGEIVIEGDGGLDFDALLLRIHPAASRVRMLAEQTPASFIAFDLLAVDDRSLLDSRQDERRRLLEISLKPTRRCFLTPQTKDPVVAAEWFEKFEGAGLDGIIAKRSDQIYSPGKRVMMKVKHQRTADCVVGGYRLSKDGDGVGSLLLGLFDGNGVLHYVGHTSSFKSQQRAEILEVLRPLEGGSFAGGRSPGGPSRWNQGKDLSWTSVRPDLVCEVTFDHLQGDRFRHGTTFLRWRSDKPPRDCDFDQLEFAKPFSLEEIRRLSPTDG